MNDLIAFDAGEKPLLIVRKHWAIFVRDVLASCLAAVLPFLLWALATRTELVPDVPVIAAGAHYLGTLWLLVVWITLFVLWTEYFLDVWIITDRRIFNIQQVGLFHRQSSSCEIENVQEIVVHTDNFLQTLLHYGTVRIQTAGPSGEYITAEGVPHPERVRAAIQAQTGIVAGLEEKNKKQQELLHMVAHEVKGYLGKNAAVLASIVEGDYGTVSDPLKSTAASALTNTRTGVSTVMEILEGSNLETGSVQYEQKPFDLAASVRTVAAAVEPLAQEKKLTYTVVQDPRPCIVLGDKAKIENHVLRNLFENAVRYTPAGTVSIGITQVDTNAIVYTQDTGVGISPEDMGKLFTEGGHGTDSRKVNPSSTGFGLFIAKQIVDAHGGHVWAESDGPGTGSRFFLVLPLSVQ
jgi:signal transduction histidine kinase